MGFIDQLVGKVTVWGRHRRKTDAGSRIDVRPMICLCNPSTLRRISVPERKPMRIRYVSLALLALVAIAALQTPSQSLPEATTFQVDAVHSGVLFRANHLGVSHFYGRFNGVAGSFTVQEGGTGSVEITIDANSVDTNNAKRDGHLKGPDFFSAAQFPKINFSGTLKHTDGKNYEAAGKLTFRGVTKNVTVTLERIGTKNAMGGLRTGFEGSFTIKMSDYGSKWAVEKKALSDEVKLIIAIEGLNK